MEIAPDVLVECISKLDPKIAEMNVEELKKKYNFSTTDKALRKKFQDEYYKATAEERNFKAVNVYGSIVHENTWRTRVITNKYRLAYMLQPIQETEDELNVLEQDFIDGLRQIAEKGPFTKDLKVSEYIAAARMVLDRTAPTVQRQEIKQMNLKADLTKGSMSNEQLGQQLKKLIEDHTGTKSDRKASDDKETGGGGKKA